MRVTMSGRHMELSDALRTHVENRLRKLKRHFDRVIDVDVVMAVEKHRHIAEITLNANSLRIHGRESTEDMYNSVDAVVEKLDKQILRYKTRIKNYQPRKAQEQRVLQHTLIAVPEEEEGNGNQPVRHRVVHREKLDMKPMSVEEAALQLELAEEPFLAFTNADTHQVNVLYPRGDGTYGLIEPEF